MESSSSSNGGTAKNGSPAHLHQIAILRSMYCEEWREPEPRTYQIEEIAELSGLGDERETQRYLFILEGQKLVTPYPEGDFTSKSWQITAHGIRALRVIKKSTVSL